MTDARDNLRVRSINGSPAVECRRTDDGGVECRYLLPDGSEGHGGAPWQRMPDADIRRQIAMRTPIGAWIAADLVRRLGEAIWRDQWQPRMADALDVEREIVSDWRRARRTPNREQWATLYMIAREQRAQLDRAIDDMALL